MQVYTEAQHQQMYSCMFLRQKEAEAHVRNKVSFKGIARHLETQIEGRDYKVLKTKLNKLLQPQENSNYSNSSGQQSLLQVPFFMDAMMQALQGELEFKANCQSTCESLADLETRESSSVSLGKRSPLNSDSSDFPMSLFKQEETFSSAEEPCEGEFEQNLEPSIQRLCMEGLTEDIHDYREPRYSSRPGSDLQTPFGIDQFHNFIARHPDINENLDDYDNVKDQFPSIAGFDGEPFSFDRAYN